MNEEITLYPSNWLYNAGVVGFLRVLEDCGENVENFLKDDGSVEVDLSLLRKVDVEKLYFSKEKISSIVGNAPIYRNYLQSSWKPIFKDFLNKLLPQVIIRQGECDICGVGYFIPEDAVNNYSNKNTLNKFLHGIEILDVRLNNLLAPSQKFPNSFWDNSISVKVCHLCGYILIHHHISLIKIPDNSEIFINAPSFKLMWHLNNYAQKLYGKAHSVKEILGISLIELARKMYIQLGKWEKMNIEVVIKYRVKRNDKWEDVIEFFSLPYEIVDLISNREIASLLNEIGEFKVLNYVLDGKFNMILEFGERIMRIALKPKSEWGKNENDFINENVKLQKNKDNLMTFSQNLFKLYALINDKTKKEVLI